MSYQPIPCPKCGAMRPTIETYPEDSPSHHLFYYKCRNIHCDFRSGDTPDPKLARIEWSIAVKKYWDEKYPPLDKDRLAFFNTQEQAENRVSPSGVPIPDDRVQPSGTTARGSALPEQDPEQDPAQLTIDNIDTLYEPEAVWNTSSVKDMPFC